MTKTWFSMQSNQQNINKIKNTISITLGSAEYLLNSTTKMLSANNLKPERILFVTHDNCSTMAGVVGGYKKMMDQLREDEDLLFPNILDIDGCSVTTYLRQQKL